MNPHSYASKHDSFDIQCRDVSRDKVAIVNINDTRSIREWN